MFFEGLSGNAFVSFAVKPLYFALFQVGCVGLIKAIDNFDTTLDVIFSTYAVPMNGRW